MNDFIIISDLHLASNVCRAEKILRFLEEIQTNTLILNGDVFDNLNFSRLKKSHWKVLKKIRSLANQISVKWIRGNHDTKNADIIAHLIGVDFLEDYILKIENKTILITHGDRFDIFMKERPITSRIADQIYRLIQAFDKTFGKNYYYSNLVKSKSKKLIRCGKVIENSMNYCLNRNIDVVICGHTHMATYLTNKNHSVEYYNSGCWTDKICTYITINRNQIEIKEYI